MPERGVPSRSIVRESPDDAARAPFESGAGASGRVQDTSFFPRLFDRLLANAVRAVVLILVIALAIVALPIALALICAAVLLVGISLVRARLRRGRSSASWSTTTTRTEVVDAEWSVQESGSAPEASPGEPRTEADDQDEADGRRNVRVRR